VTPATAGSRRRIRAWPALLDRTLGPHAGASTLDQLQALRDQRSNAAFRDEFMAIKRANKARLAAHIEKAHRHRGRPRPACFDVQVKRIHEYKRQLLNLLHVVTRYPGDPRQPRKPAGCRAR